MFDLVTLNDGRRVLAKLTKHGLEAKTFANLRSAHHAAEKVKAEVPEGVLVRVVGYRPFYVALADWTDAFEQCCEGFRNEIVALAKAHGKSVMQVFLWWREYENRCSGEGGQSTIMSEFKQWYAEKLGPVVEKKPLPDLLTVAKNLLEICRVKCSPLDEDGQKNHATLIEACEVIAAAEEKKP